MPDNNHVNRPVVYWLDLLKAEDSLRQEEAAWALAAAERAIVQGLVEALRAEAGSVRAEVAFALASIGSHRAKEAVPILIDRMAHGPEAERGRAVAALGQMGPDAEAAIPHLQALLGGPDETVRSQAADALASIRPSSRLRPAEPRGCGPLLATLLLGPIALIAFMRAWR